MKRVASETHKIFFPKKAPVLCVILQCHINVVQFKQFLFLIFFFHQSTIATQFLQAQILELLA